MCGIHGKAEFGISVEALKHRHSHGVGQAPIAGSLVGASEAKVGVSEKCRVVAGACVQKQVFCRFVVECPDEACHGHVGAAYYGVGHRVALVAVVAHFVALVEIQLTAAEPVVGSGEACGYALEVDACVASLHLGGVGDVAVVGDSSVLFVQEVVAVEKSLHLVAVAHVRGAESPGEVFVGLVVKRALTVDVVHHGTHLQALPCIAAEGDRRAVLVAVFVAAGAVANQGHWDARVVEALCVDAWQPCPEGIGKEEVALLLAVEEHLALPLGSIVAGGGVGTAHGRRDKALVVVFVQRVDGRFILQPQRVGDAPCARRPELGLRLGLDAHAATQCE